MSGHGKNILLSPDHLMQPRTNYFFFLSTQWFSPKNLSILIKYWNIFSFPARVSELASKHESQQEESPLRLAVLRPWSQRHDPLLPHLPPPDGLQVLLHQRLLRPPFCRWERHGVAVSPRTTPGCDLLTLIEMFLRVAGLGTEGGRVAGYYLVMIPPGVPNNDGRDTVVI